MRRFIAATLLSTTLAMSCFTAVNADEASPSSNTATSDAATGSNEDADINSRAKHKRMALKKHLKHRLASKSKKETSTIDQSSAKTESETTTTAASDSTAGDKTSPAATNDTVASSSDANKSTTDATSSDDKSKTTDSKKYGKKNRLATLKSKKTRLADATTPAGTPASGPKTASKKSDVNIAERLASTLVGTIVGTPVNVVKKTVTETIVATKDLVGDTDNWFLLAPAGSFGVVAGVLSGSLQAPVVAGYRAWKNSADEPFGADSMSLGDGK